MGSSPQLTRSRSGALPPHSPNAFVPAVARSRSAAKGRPSGAAPSAWALSPGRCPAAADAAGKRNGLLGIFRKKKTKREDASMEEHQLRVLAARLLQWRFVNARQEAAMAATATAQNKIFFAWLKIADERNIVTAKRILIQRIKQKLKAIKVLNPQVNLLNRWDLVGRRHTEAVPSLINVLEAACTPIPLVETAKANLMMVHKYMLSSMDIILAIEANIKTLCSKAEQIKSLSFELVQVMQREVECLVELRSTKYLITCLEMYEISLRASIVQAKKKLTAPLTYEINTWRNFHHHSQYLN